MALEHTVRFPIMALLCGLLISANINTATCLEGSIKWGIKKGDKITVEYKTLVIRKNYDEVYSEKPNIDGLTIKNGTKVVVNVIANLPTNYSEFAKSDEDDFFFQTVDGKLVNSDKGAQTNSVTLEEQVGTPYKDYDLFPPLIAPLELNFTHWGNYTMEDYVRSYANDWNEVISADRLIGKVDLASSGNEVILEVNITDLEVGKWTYEEYDCYLKVIFDMKTGIRKQFALDLENVVASEMVATHRKDKGLLGIDLPVMPTVFSLAFLAIIVRYLRYR